MDMREKKVSGETIFKGKIFTVEKDIIICPNGNESFREVVRHNGGAGVLCVTKDNKVVLIKQYRYPYDEIMYEIPAGKLEMNEDPMLAAAREFEEETGNKPINIEFLNVIYPTCGYSAEKIYVYLVKDFEVGDTNLDEDEFVETELIEYDKVLKMINDGVIKDAKTICAIMTYHIRYKR